MSPPLPENPPPSIPINMDWRSASPGSVRYTPVPYRPSRKMLILACILFLLTLCTCLVAGTQFATAYAQNEAFSFDEFLRSFTLFYKHPLGLAAGLPFALTLLTILLTHELGHFFACRYHHIRATYPFFVPFPNLNGTFGAFILIRSPILTNRALFDVGASGPLVGFVFAVPALVYGVLHAKLVPGLADPANAEVIYGTPLLLRLLDAVLHPGVSPDALLLPPIGRAAWVGLFVTSLNLVPVAQLDGGHILRSLSPRIHRYSSILLPAVLILLGLVGFWDGWYIWGALLLAMRFLRVAPIYDPATLDRRRRWGALLALLIFLLSFMPVPFYFPPSSH
ncbi:MAG TPA: site-2 protease family protein [Candidatus Acidoferrales bacterium]|nr:site-2 protease family protein [Candidatus Acidoferrales bacterium]